MWTVTLVLFLSILSCGLASDGVTLLMCYRDGNSSSGSDSHAFVRVNEGSWVRPTESGYGVSYCAAFKKNSPKNAVITLETASIVSEPQEFSLEVDEFFTDTVAGAVIYCFGSEEDVPYKLIGSYHCDEGVKVIFSGTSRRQFDEEYSSDKKVRRKRSGQSSKTISEIVCSKGQLPPTFNINDLSQQHRQTLGQICTIQDDEYAKTIGRIYLINSTGGIDCLPCCIDHYWNNVSKQCERCKSGTTRKRPGFWDSCEPIRARPTKAPTPTGISTSTVADDDTTTTPIPKTTTPKLELPGKPTGLNVFKVGNHYAILRWNGARSKRIRYYRVVNTENGSNKSQSHKVRESLILLTDLNAKSCYEVTVEARNPSGYGPKNSIEFETLRALHKPSNVHKLNGTGSYAWDVNPEERDLTIKVEIRELEAENPAVWTFTKFYSSGQIEIPLKHITLGKFSVQLFYATDDQNGPKSEKIIDLKGEEHASPEEVDEKPSTSTGVNGGCIASYVIMGIIISIVIIFVGVLIWDFKIRNKSWCTSYLKRFGYTPVPTNPVPDS